MILHAISPVSYASQRAKVSRVSLEEEPLIGPSRALEVQDHADVSPEIIMHAGVLGVLGRTGPEPNRRHLKTDSSKVAAAKVSFPLAKSSLADWFPGRVRHRQVSSMEPDESTTNTQQLAACVIMTAQM